MFPLSDQTFLSLVFTGVALCSALGMLVGGKYRLLFWLIAAALPAWLLWSNPPSGYMAELAYIIILGVFLISFGIGAMIGFSLKRMGARPLVSAGLLAILAIGPAGYALKIQHVPAACRDQPLQVAIAGETLTLPPQLMPRLEQGAKVHRFGQISRKQEYADLCSASQNGTLAVPADAIRINPYANHTAISAVCAADQPPAWCTAFAATPYRHMAEIAITPAAQNYVQFWQDGGALATEKSGDLTQGTLCLSPRANRNTQCWAWQPFGTNGRLVISSYSVDDVFDNMPVAGALEMIEQTRAMILSIVQ